MIFHQQSLLWADHKVGDKMLLSSVVLQNLCDTHDLCDTALYKLMLTPPNYSIATGPGDMLAIQECHMSGAGPDKLNPFVLNVQLLQSTHYYDGGNSVAYW